MATTEDAIAVGVIGVGSMGRQHARVYAEVPETELVGVSDPDEEQARSVADDYGTRTLDRDRLLEVVDAVSVAAPDRFHYELSRQALDAGVDVLVEKPFVTDVDDGRDLIERAEADERVLQVGHVERFNPVVRTLRDVLVDEEVLSLEADRLGPPLGRDIDDNPVYDLMVHDVDVVCSLLDEDVESVQATQTRDAPHVTAMLSFDAGTTARLTASRATQKKVRRLAVTTRDARIEADYLAQTVEIHRRSVPEYVAQNGDVRYRHEGVIERPTVERGEPLKKELKSFAESVRTGSTPEVTGRDGLRALEVAERVDERAAESGAPGADDGGESTAVDDDESTVDDDAETTEVVR